MSAQGDGEGEARSGGEAQDERFTEAVRKGAYIDTAMDRTLAAVVNGMGVDCATAQALYDEVERLRTELKDIRIRLRGLPQSVLHGEHGLARATMASLDIAEDYIEKFEWLHTELGCHIMRDSVAACLGVEPWIVLDVDLDVICRGNTIEEAVSQAWEMFHE